MKTEQLFDLTGKVAVITGGSRGIGLQMAEALGERGASIALSARKQHELDEAQAHFDALGIACFTVRNDLSDFASIPGLAETILGHYGLHPDVPFPPFEEPADPIDNADVSQQ